MRTTLDIDDAVLQQAKELAARTNRPLREIIEDMLRESLARMAKSPSDRPVKLIKSSARPGVRPGVNLDSWADLLDVMDGLDDSPGR